MQKPNTYLPMAARILTALAIPGAARTQVPFKGTLQGQDAHHVLPPEATSVLIHTTATGTANQLGRFSLVLEVTGNLVSFTEAGSAQWIAAKRRQHLHDHSRTGGTVGFAPAASSRFLRFRPLLAGQVGSREPRAASPSNSTTSWRRAAYPTASKRTTSSALPRDNYLSWCSSLKFFKPDESGHRSEIIRAGIGKGRARCDSTSSSPIRAPSLPAFEPSLFPRTLASSDCPGSTGTLILFQ